MRACVCLRCCYVNTVAVVMEIKLAAAAAAAGAMAAAVAAASSLLSLKRFDTCC